MLKSISIVIPVIFLYNNLLGKVDRIQTTNIKYNNLIILVDFSSRLNNYPPKDIVEIEKIINYFRDKCVMPGIKIEDKSSFYFSALTKRSNIQIDLETKGTTSLKQCYVNSTGPYLNKGFRQDLSIIKEKIKKEYRNTKNQGLDLISLLNEKIQNDLVIKAPKSHRVGNLTNNFLFENHIYLFTDGYLEFNTMNASRQFLFGLKEINRIRQFCITNHKSIKEALMQNPILGLQPIKSDKNHLINLHILETHERDKSISTQTYKNPLGLRDNEILEAVWRKWALESGFKSFDWKKY